MRKVSAIFKVTMKSWYRSKSALFWTLTFPILLIVLFGLIFGQENNSFSLYVQNNDVYQSGENSKISAALVGAFNATGPLIIINVPKDVDPLEYMKNDAANSGRGERLLVIPRGFEEKINSHRSANVTLMYDQTQQASLIAVNIAQGAIDAFNAKLTGAIKVIQVESTPLVSKDFQFIDFFVPGVVGLTVMTTTIFGSIERNTTYREKGIIKKLATTPLSKLEWIIGIVSQQTVLAFISSGVVLLVGRLVFNVNISVNGYFIILMITGALLFSGIGMLIANFVREPEAAEAAGNAITFPMMFLSGIFWPLEQLPDFLQTIAKVLPLTYLSDGLRDASINSNFSGALTNTTIILILAAFFITVGAMVTNWKEK